MVRIACLPCLLSRTQFISFHFWVRKGKPSRCCYHSLWRRMLWVEMGMKSWFIYQSNRCLVLQNSASSDRCPVTECLLEEAGQGSQPTAHKSAPAGGGRALEQWKYDWPIKELSSWERRMMAAVVQQHLKPSPWLSQHSACVGRHWMELEGSTQMAVLLWALLWRAGIISMTRGRC